MDILYSRVNKPKRRDPGPATDQPDPKGGGAILALGRTQPTRSSLGLKADKSLLENVYESIQEMGAPLEHPSSSSYQGKDVGRAQRHFASCLSSGRVFIASLP